MNKPYNVDFVGVSRFLYWPRPFLWCKTRGPIALI
jgi:hypothetical protein